MRLEKTTTHAPRQLPTARSVRARAVCAPRRCHHRKLCSVVTGRCAPVTHCACGNSRPFPDSCAHWTAILSSTNQAFWSCWGAFVQGACARMPSTSRSATQRHGVCTVGTAVRGVRAKNAPVVLRGASSSSLAPSCSADEVFYVETL